MPLRCALLGEFAIGAQVALLWQNNANAKCYRVQACTRSMPSLGLSSVITYGQAIYAAVSFELLFGMCIATKRA